MAHFVNLLAIADPKNLTSKMAPSDVGIGNRSYAMPFVTIESLVVLGDRRIAVMNDNNLPFSVGRHVATGKPDGSELVILDLEHALGN